MFFMCKLKFYQNLKYFSPYYTIVSQRELQGGAMVEQLRSDLQI